MGSSAPAPQPPTRPRRSTAPSAASSKKTCPHCGFVFNVRRAEEDIILANHIAKCTHKRQETFLEGNLREMSELDIERGEQFYFRKVPVDASRTRFVWRKEAVQPPKPLDPRKLAENPDSYRFESKFVALRTEL
jgi:hypothetical protein